MPRAIYGFFSLTVFLISALSVTGSATAWGQIKTDRFFPETTKGFFAVADAPGLRERWAQTEPGKLLSNPSFNEFRDSLREGLDKAWESRFGMGLGDMTAIASGEIGGGLIASSGKTPGWALVVEVKGKDAEVKEFLTKMVRKATEAYKGESRREKISLPHGALDVTVLSFPPDAHFPKPRMAYYVPVGDYLIAADQSYLIELLVSPQGASLAGLPAYQKTIQRCRADDPSNAEPQVRFFVAPLEFGEAVHSLRNLSEEEKRKPSPYRILAKQGFNGIDGVGGTLNLMTGSFDLLTRIKVYIPEAPTGALRMLSFRDAGEIPLANWIDEESCRSGALQLDLLTLFNNVGPLFDDFLETPGVWDETIVSLEKDERGPKVNLKTDLFAHLGPQISVVRAFRGLEEKYLAGATIASGKGGTVAEVFRRMFETDPDFQKVPHENGMIWCYAPQKKDAARSASNRTATTRRNRPQPTTTTPTPEVPEFARSVFYVTPDTLFISNDVEFLKEMLAARTAGKIRPLNQSDHFKAIGSLIRQESPSGYFLRGFSDNQEELRVNYALIQANKLREGKTLLGRFTRLLMGDSTTAFTVDGTKLPPFTVLENQIGPSGFFGRTEPDGWFFKGFALRSDQAK